MEVLGMDRGWVGNVCGPNRRIGHGYDSSELERYLCTDVEHVTNPVAWWYEWHAVYPSLSRMALDYLTIPGEYTTLS